MIGLVNTVGQRISVQGVGLHTGASACVTLLPAVAGSGRVFVRDGVPIPALAEFVTDTRRCTTLGREGMSVATVEHLLAALMLAEVDDVIIDVDGPELPALDGAAKAWYSAILSAGIHQQDGEIKSVSLSKPCWHVDEGSSFFVTPSDRLAIYAAIDIPETVVSKMMAGGNITDGAVREQLLRARTYGLAWEVEALLKSGLAKGGSLDNAVVLTHDGYMNPEVWPEEPAWHKALDLLGDLALVGARLRMSVTAVCGGHRSHVGLARLLREEYRG